VKEEPENATVVVDPAGRIAGFTPIPNWILARFITSLALFALTQMSKA